MSKYIESYGKQALAVNQRHPKEAVQEAILCFAYFRLIENGLFLEYNLYWQGVTQALCLARHNQLSKI